MSTRAVPRAGRGTAGGRELPLGTPQWIRDLQASVSGAVSVPGMPNYESARAIAVPLHPARPAAIVSCATEQDVRVSLLTAQDRGISFRLRSGRHHRLGYSTIDGGLVIDVRQLKDIAVDRVARTATVGAGANLGELDSALDVHMLHVPAGSLSSVGVAGFVQGGGHGWTARQYGMNCDRVGAVRVMLADGRVVRATRDLNASLLWAICGGGGGNVGVLLDVTYDLAGLYLVWGFELRWPIDDAPRVLTALQQGFMRGGDAPDELGYRAILATIDGALTLMLVGMFDGDRQAGMEAIAPLTAIGACTMTLDVIDAYNAVSRRLLDSEQPPGRDPHGMPVPLRSGYVNQQVGDDAWTAIVELFKSSADASNLAIVSPSGGQVARIPPDDCAFVHRAVDMMVSVYAMWSGDLPQGIHEQSSGLANGVLELLAPFRDGSVYQNLPERDLPDYRTAYWGSNFGKLLAVKRLADPADVFTNPQGITPDPAAPAAVEPLPELEPEPYMVGGYDLRPNGQSPFTGHDAGTRRHPTGPGAMAATSRSDGDRLRARLGELSDLGRAGVVLAWDEQVTMPAGGAAARGAMLGTLQRLAHEKLLDGELSLLLAAADPDDPVVRVIGRDRDRARRVPSQLSEDILRAGSEGMAAWLDARAHNDFGRFEPALRRNVELARAYADCFPESRHPYDALLDRYEPGATTAEVGALLRSVCDGVAPLVADLAARTAPDPLAGPFDPESQRAVALEMAAALGFHADGFRLDGSVHPFASASTPADVRVTARFEHGSLGGLFEFLHEMGHALYERGIDPALARTALDGGTSMGVHESQGLLWGTVIGRDEPFWSCWLPRLREAMPEALGDMTLDGFLRAINVVRPGPIRVDADAMTYPLHILQRFELEVALVDGALDPADLPAAWAQRSSELLGVTAPDDLSGVLQDIHWAQGAIGYFPTYAIGSVFAAQLWDAMRVDLPWIDDDLRAGDYGGLCGWLRERVHRHGRALTPPEVIAHAVGGPLDAGPLLAQLEAKHRALYEPR